MIGSSYHPNGSSAWFYTLWLQNTFKYSTPDQVVVLADSRAVCPVWHPSVEWISMRGDLGHVYDLLAGRKNYEWCGWSMAVCTTALLAYGSECDYIWKEQDVLAFGPWVERIYNEAAGKEVLFGSVEGGPAAQSLFFVRHNYIPEFVRLYLGTGDERKVENIGEAKFARLEAEHREFGRYAFGYDRQRPLKLEDEVFYAQKFTPFELSLLAIHGLIILPESMPDVAAFTGDPKKW